MRPGQSELWPVPPVPRRPPRRNPFRPLPSAGPLLSLESHVDAFARHEQHALENIALFCERGVERCHGNGVRSAGLRRDWRCLANAATLGGAFARLVAVVSSQTVDDLVGVI